MVNIVEQRESLQRGINPLSVRCPMCQSQMRVHAPIPSTWQCIGCIALLSLQHLKFEVLPRTTPRSQIKACESLIMRPVVDAQDLLFEEAHVLGACQDMVRVLGYNEARRAIALRFEVPPEREAALMEQVITKSLPVELA